jgi:5-methyltetrahydropteroyltriglutamate--homocysteine methyltransferase
MLRATRDLTLPTTVIGSLPRPGWYTENLAGRPFLQAMVDVRFREQYTDAVSVYLRDQETAGLDICTDGDCHFDEEVAGYSWFSYPVYRMSGFDHAHPQPYPAAPKDIPYPRGHILHDFLESRVVPRIVGPVGRGTLQFAAMWKTAQRLSRRPVKFGTITPELLAGSVQDDYYGNISDRIMAISNALNEELNELADAGCPIVQMEEPQIHMVQAKGKVGGVLDEKDMVDIFNNTVRGLGAKTEVWCHTCWGNPAQQRMFRDDVRYGPVLEQLNRVDADVITFESCSNGGRELPAIGEIITGKKIAIGVINHHSLQVERPEEVAAHLRLALKHIPAERLIVASDCGMGREGMSRRHAFYKMVSLVLGTNMVRRELGLPEAECLAADPRFSLTQAP